MGFPDSAPKASGAAKPTARMAVTAAVPAQPPRDQRLISFPLLIETPSVVDFE
jgi:hypothetical protein